MKAKACLPYIFPFQLPCEGKRKFFLTVLPTAPSWNDENGLCDSSGLFILLTKPCLCSDCAKLRKIKEDLQQNILIKKQGAWRLRQHKTELELKEKVEQQQALERADHDRGLV